MKLKLLLFKRTFLRPYCILATTLSYDINKLKGSVNSGSPFISLIKICFTIATSWYWYGGCILIKKICFTIATSWYWYGGCIFPIFFLRLDAVVACALRGVPGLSGGERWFLKQLQSIQEQIPHLNNDIENLQTKLHWHTTNLKVIICYIIIQIIYTTNLKVVYSFCTTDINYWLVYEVVKLFQIICQNLQTKLHWHTTNLKVSVILCNSYKYFHYFDFLILSCIMHTNLQDISLTFSYLYDFGFYLNKLYLRKAILLQYQCMGLFLNASLGKIFLLYWY